MDQTQEEEMVVTFINHHQRQAEITIMQGAVADVVEKNLTAHMILILPREMSMVLRTTTTMTGTTIAVAVMMTRGVTHLLVLTLTRGEPRLLLRLVVMLLTGMSPHEENGETALTDTHALQSYRLFSHQSSKRVKSLCSVSVVAKGHHYPYGHPIFPPILDEV